MRHGVARALPEVAHISMKTMKLQFELLRPFRFLAPTLFAAIAVLGLCTTPVTANGREPVPAATLNKLDEQLVLVVKKSRAEAPFDKTTTLEPDVYKRHGRVLLEIDATFSRELSDQITSLGGEVVTDWGSTTRFRAWLPFAQLEVLAARPDIKSIAAARPTITHRLKP
jgi:hypothetical protein